MINSSNELETLKMKLKSATKLKLCKEKELCQVHNKERCLNEELMSVKSESELLQEQLEEVKIQIANTRHQLTMIGICRTSEECKTAAHLGYLDRHRKGFQEIFNKEREHFEIRMKDLKEKEAAEEDELRQEEMRLLEKREQKAAETAVVATECDTIERECAVLKKRNHAIMLKLRRKLLATEKTRRETAMKNTEEIIQ